MLGIFNSRCKSHSEMRSVSCCLAIATEYVESWAYAVVQ